MSPIAPTTARPAAPPSQPRAPASPGAPKGPNGAGQSHQADFAAWEKEMQPGQSNGAARKFDSLAQAQKEAKALPADAFRPVDGGYILDAQKVSDFVLDVVPEFFAPSDSGPLSEQGLTQQALAVHQDAEGDTRATSFFTKDAMYTKLEIGSLNKSVWFQRNYDAPRIDLGSLFAQQGMGDASSFASAQGQAPAPTALNTPPSSSNSPAARVPQRDVF